MELTGGLKESAKEKERNIEGVWRGGLPRLPERRHANGTNCPRFRASVRGASQAGYQRMTQTKPSRPSQALSRRSAKKLLIESKFFSPLTSRIAAFYQGFLRVAGERRATHAVHPIVHPRVHLSESGNSQKEKNLDARRWEFWALPKHRSGLERPRPFATCAPKEVLGVVPAHSRVRKVSTMQKSAICIP